jgi:hypothetical protein
VDTLTMNIKRRWFAEIVAKTKRVEYRDQSPFWKRRIEPLKTPFKLRLLNGMTPPIPEATVVVTQVRLQPPRGRHVDPLARQGGRHPGVRPAEGEGSDGPGGAESRLGGDGGPERPAVGARRGAPPCEGEVTAVGR